MIKVGSFTKDFRDWRNETITVVPFSTYDSHGGVTYGSSATVSCFISYEKKMITAHDGQEVVTSAQIYIVGSTSRSVLDKITMPDSTTPRLLRVDHYYNEIGVVELTVIYT